MNNRFGNYIVDLRNKKMKDMSSRQVAKLLEITPQYMCDIENGSRIPSAQILNKIVDIFKLEEDEKNKLYDYAATSYKNNKVPADIADFIINNDEAKNVIRQMMNEQNMGEVSL